MFIDKIKKIIIYFKHIKIVNLFILLACKLLIERCSNVLETVMMKKALWVAVGLFFVLSTFTLAADKTASPAKADLSKTNIVKAAKMHATGKVVEISDTFIKIERTVKGDIETMEFALEKPFAGISVNDSVKIEYTEKDGNLTASRVSKVALKKKEIKLPETKSVPGKK